MTELPPLQSRLVIVPSRRALERQSPRDTRDLSNHTTFEALVAALGAPPGQRFASSHVVFVLVRALLRQSTRLAHLGEDALGVRAACRALLELRMAGITADGLGNRGVHDSDEPLVALLGNYENALHGARLFDAADRARDAVLAVATGRLPPSLSRVQRVVVSGVADLGGVRLDLLRAFAARGAEVRVELPFDPARAEAFAWSATSLHRIERARPELSLTFDPRIGEGPLSPLRAAHFTRGHARGAPVRVWRLPATPEHHRSIAAAVAGWIREGVPPDEIAVVCPNLDHDATALSDALEAWDIPSHCRTGSSLANSRAVHALAAMLASGEQPVRREALIELYHLLGRHVATHRGPLSPGELGTWLRRAGVHVLDANAPSELPIRAARALRYGAEQAGTIAEDVAAVLGALEAPPQETLQGWVPCLLRWIEQLGPAASQPRPSREPLAFVRREVLEAQAAVALRELLLDLAAAARTSPIDAPWTRDQLADALHVLTAETRLPAAGLRAGAVTLATPYEMVGARFERVAIVGVDGGTFPRNDAPDPVLDDALRTRINRAYGESRLAQRAPFRDRDALRPDARDRWLWLEILAAAQSEVLVTYTQGDTEEHGKSELLLELERAAQQAPCAPPPSYRPAVSPLALATGPWALGHAAGGVRTQSPLSAAAWSALDQTLRARAPARHAHLTHRVAHHAAVGLAAHALPTLAGPTRAAIAAHYRDRVLSASKLDLLGRCTFKHVCATLWRLEPDDAPTLGADPREQGNVAHAALHLAYQLIIQRGGLAAARRDPEGAISATEALVRAHAHEVMAETNVHPLVADAALDDAWRAVRALLERDLAAEDPFEPVAVEYAFSDLEGAPAPPLALRGPDGRVLRVRGSIDRVDRGGGTLRVIDYKRRDQARADGRHFQLPVYAAAALRDLDPRAQRVETAWLNFNSGKLRVPEDVATDPAALTEQIAGTVWPRLTRLMNGDVSPDPESKKECGSCDFRTVCRFEPGLAEDVE